MLIGPEDWRFSKSNADVLLSHYRAHNASVKALVPKEKLLVYRIGEGWEPICKFLGKPIPGLVLKNIIPKPIAEYESVDLIMRSWSSKMGRLFDPDTVR